MKTSMKTARVALATALCAFAPLSAALADYRVGPQMRPLPRTTWDRLSTGSIMSPEAQSPSLGGCLRSSAQEGNADQQHFPVKQYGQTAGGYRC
jgi:hypothetical protein